MEKQLTDNFRLSEFVCKCGCGADYIDLHLVGLLQVIRTLFGKPLYIHSGVRCRVHKSSPAVGGSGNSAHLTGKAIDIGYTKATDRHRLLEIIMHGSEDIIKLDTLLRVKKNLPVDERRIERNQKED